MLYKQKLFMSQVSPKTPPLKESLNVGKHLNVVKLNIYTTILDVLCLSQYSYKYNQKHTHQKVLST